MGGGRHFFLRRVALSSSLRAASNRRIFVDCIDHRLPHRSPTLNTRNAIVTTQIVLTLLP